MGQNDKLEVEESRGVYKISWWLGEDDDYGASMGDDGPTCKFKVEDLAKEKDPSYREHMAYVIASYSLREEKPAGHRDGFFWDTRPQAERALRLIKAMGKAMLEGVPMPEWALTALSQGWKPPKGWKP